jgi:ribosome-interacting GTPase 1
MPTNVPPQYHEAEARLRQAKTREEKLAIMEEMMAIMPKHKGTDKLRSELNQKIKRLKEASDKEKKSGARKAVHVPREGAGQIVLIGPPNGGKSQLLCALTNAAPEVASYPFTTRIPVPGMMPFENIKIQLVEVPAITESAMEIWAPEIIRAADLALMVLDISAPDLLDCVEAIKKQLEKHYVFLVKEMPDEKKIGASYIRTIILANKMDLQEARNNLPVFKEWLGNQFDVIELSALNDENIKSLPARFFSELRIIRVYTKAPGKKLEKQDPIILPAGSSVLDAAQGLHKEIAQKLKFAKVWGEGMHDGQQVARDQIVKDGWALEFHT